MKDETHKRMAGDYEIIQAIHIGDREIVLGEKLQNENGDKYMCAFCQQNELFAAYSEVMCSDNYAEMVKMFGERITEQAEKTRVAMNAPKIQGIDDRPITASDCTVVSCEDDLNNKIVVIKPEVLRREYRRATCQLKLCTGGFGAYPRSRAQAASVLTREAVAQPVFASTSIPEKRAGMSVWMFLASWNRKNCPDGQSTDC